MNHRKFKLALGAIAIACNAVTLHAQMAQDPLLSRTASVEPNIVFAVDDSRSMLANVIYEYGTPSSMGPRGPNGDPTGCNSTSGSVNPPVYNAGTGHWSGGDPCYATWINPTTKYGLSPDVNRMAYDPRQTYTRRVNKDGTLMPAGSTGGITSFSVYFFKPAGATIYSVQSIGLTAPASSNGGLYSSNVSGAHNFAGTQLSGGTVATANVTAALAGRRVTGVTLGAIAGLYPSASTTTTAVFTAAGAGGTTALGTAALINAGVVESVATSTQNFPSNCPTGVRPAASVTVNNGGTGGTGLAVTVTIGTVSGNRRATAIAVTSRGSGYTTAPTITVSCGSGSSGGSSPRNYSATLFKQVGSVTISNVTGNLYPSGTPNVTFGVPAGTGTVQAGAGTATMSGNLYAVTAVTLGNAGSSYTTQPTLTLPNQVTAASFNIQYNSASTSVNAPWANVPAATDNCSNAVGTSCPTGPVADSYYFTPSYLPDAGSPLALGANATLVYPNVVNSTANTSGRLPKFINRTDCVTSTAHCTWAEELQNYANYKAYHNTRIKLAATGIGVAFQPLNPTFRLGYANIHDLEGTNPITGNTARLRSGVRRYVSAVRDDFLDWMYGLEAKNPVGTGSTDSQYYGILYGGTPNRQALNAIGTYFQRRDDGGPWGGSPTGDYALTNAGSNDSHASCRRSYALLMTDGYYGGWSGANAGNPDSTTGTPITQDGNYTYTPIGPYSDFNGGASTRSNTMADVAMKYWVNDLRSTVGNKVKVIAGVDEAFWQHLNFYAIGLGVRGTLDPTNPATLQALTGNASTTPPRTMSWPDPGTGGGRASIDDLWHATLNGRGRMLSAKTAAELNTAIQRMMSDVAGSTGTQAGVAVSTSSLTQGTKKYTPQYVPVQWTGNLVAYKLDPTTGSQIEPPAWQVETLVSTDPATGVKTYSTLMPAAASRNIVVGNGATTGARAVPFLFTDINNAGLTAQMTGTVNDALINYLRGDTTYEDDGITSSTGPNEIYRNRRTRLGDIVNSTPALVKNTLNLNYDKLPGGFAGQSSYASFRSLKNARTEGVVFVGANDGMLHAFRDGIENSSGVVTQPGGLEVFAYVPHALLPSLSQLADKAYTHRYYVDGPISETDAFLGGGWKNIVLGSTGGGAGVVATAGTSPRTGVFAIDTTSLNTSVTGLGASSVMWEANSTQTDFDELGYVLTDIQGGVTTNGDWIAVFGNGYESKSCKAQLFIVNLSTGALLKKLDTGVGSCATGSRNGLGGVRLVRNANQQVIGAYAGDLLGNVWKFNLNGGYGTWAVDLGGNALYNAGTTNPITAPPAVITLPIIGTTEPAAPGYMVVFGTGKFYEINDITNEDQQRLYGILDNKAFGNAGTTLSGVADLVQQTVGAPQVGANGNTYFAITNNEVKYVGSVGGTKRGWYINFPNTGQRLVYPIDLLVNRFAIADSISPSNVSTDPCAQAGSGTGYLYIVDALNGGGPTEAILDTDGDNDVDASDLVVSGLQGPADGRNASLVVSSTELATKFANVSGDAPGATLITISCKLTNTCMVPAATGVKRQWRQLFLR